jgi:GH15 family glucan-1,4-alpha-glucosidase
LLRQEIYDLYYDRIEDELQTRLGFLTPKKMIEDLLGTDFEEIIDDSLDDHNGFDYIYETYIPKITDKLYSELVPIFIGRIENKLI